MDIKKTREIIKEQFGLASINEAKEMEAKISGLFEALYKSLEEVEEGASDKSKVGNLIIEKRFVKAKEGKVNGKAYSSPAHYKPVMKVK